MMRNLLKTRIATIAATMLLTVAIGVVPAAGITLAWDSPTENVDGTPFTNLAGYKLHRGLASCTYSSCEDLGNVTTVTIDDLTDEGTTHFFSVSVYNTDGIDSEFSEEVSWTVPDETAPSIGALAITNLLSGTTGRGALPNLVDCVTLSDNCSAAADISVTQSPAAGTELDLGETVVTLTATDEAGNNSACTVTAVVSPFAVTAPTAGQAAVVGLPLTIAWVGNTPAGSVTIELQRGENVTILASDLPSPDTDMSWTTVLDAGLETADDYGVRVCLANDPQVAVESGAFAVNGIQGPDSDGDGLSDGYEAVVLGTDPFNADSDGDGLVDSWETMVAHTDALNADSDSDGLSDYEEVMVTGTDANDADTDDDGVLDGDETVSNASLCECIDAFDLADPGAVVLETRRPTFVWTSECEAEYYQIDVRRMVNGKPRSYLKRWVEDWEIVGGTNLWTLDEDLASQAYTWRIRAYRVNGSRKNGKWSDYGPEFAVSVGAPTNVPTVASLFGGELDPEVVTDVEALVFSWTVCTNATAYGLAFQTLKNGKWVSHKSLSIEADEFTVNGDLVEWVKPIDFKWGSYRWHVRGENIDGDTEWPTDPEWAYFDANIAVPAGVVALVSPAAGSVEEHFMPLFTWAPVPNATKYYLRIEELKNTGKWSSKKKLWIDADDWTVVDDLLVWDSTLKLKQDKTYRWSVTAGNIAGQGAETSPAEFTVHVETPVTPIPVSPDAVVLDECHLVFFWTAVSNVTAYRIEIDQLKSNGKSWILAEKVDVESGEWIESGSRLAWVCEDTINVGSYRWRVRGENQGVDGDWSEYAVFDIVPMASPDAAAIEVAEDSRMPEYTWVSVDGATMYYMEIEYLKNDKWKLYRNVWVDDDVSAAEQGWTADDDGGMHSLTYRWRVRAWNDDGYGDWSDYAPEFTIDLGTPAGIAVALSPLEGVEVPTNRPTFTWTTVPDATGYFIKFKKNGKNVKLKQDGKTVSEAWCSGTNFTPEAGLNWGNYEWWVIAWNPDGFSEAGYSQAATFGYGLVDPIGPTGTVAAAASVTFTWDPVPETKKHKLRIYQDVNGSLQKIWYDNKVGGTNDFFTAEVELESGVNYEWWIRAYGENSKNKGDWIISGFTAE